MGFKNKKSQEAFSWIQALIIFLIVLAIIFVFYKKIYGGTEEKVPEVICETSVNTHAAAHIKGIDLSGDINCPTQYRTVKKDEDVKEELAKYMARTWRIFGKGEKKLFDENVLKRDKFCVIYYTLEFEDKKQVFNTKEFIEYLKNTEIAPEFRSIGYDEQGEKIRYYEYLTPFKTKDLDLSRVPMSDSDKIDTSYMYSTIFTYTKKGAFNELFYKATGGSVATGVVLGTVLAGGLGASQLGGITQDWDAAVVLYPHDPKALNKLDCTYLPAKQDVGEDEQKT